MGRANHGCTRRKGTGVPLDGYGAVSVSGAFRHRRVPQFAAVFYILPGSKLNGVRKIARILFEKSVSDNRWLRKRIESTPGIRDSASAEFLLRRHVADSVHIERRFVIIAEHGVQHDAKPCLMRAVGDILDGIPDLHNVVVAGLGVKGYRELLRILHAVVGSGTGYRSVSRVKVDRAAVSIKLFVAVVHIHGRFGRAGTRPAV